MDAKALHAARERDKTKRPAWIQTLGNRQEEESLTRQRSQESSSLWHLMGREGQRGSSGVNEARGRGRARSKWDPIFKTLVSHGRVFLIQQ